ncbi:MAG TPA: ornithine cyclodeaminase [Streptosporangiaceae bacterium]|nr:ornithine cyclodeaminase [Streptosporangiaceae bacterium]
MHQRNQIRYLARADVLRASSALDPVGIIRDALLLHGQGRTTLPAEAALTWRAADGASARSLALPGAIWDDEPALGIKVINGSLANPSRGLPRAQGLTILFDPLTAHPVAIMEAAHLSALRTAAYTALSVQVLGNGDPAAVSVLGCGALGEMHVTMLAERYPQAAFTLYDTVPERSAGLAALHRERGIQCVAAKDARTAVQDADVVVTTTVTTTSYLEYDWLRPGSLIAHVSLDDVTPEVVRRVDVIIVDDWELISGDRNRLLGRMYWSGEVAGPDGQLKDPGTTSVRKVSACLADVLAGRHPGRESQHQIVLSNPFGMGILDVALAACLGAQFPNGEAAITNSAGGVDVLGRDRLQARPTARPVPRPAELVLHGF